MTREKMQQITEKYADHLKNDTNAGSVENAAEAEKKRYGNGKPKSAIQEKLDAAMKGVTAKTEKSRAESINAESIKAIPDVLEKTRLEVANNIFYSPLDISYESLKSSLQDAVVIATLKRKLQSKKIEYAIEPRNDSFYLTLKASHLEKGLYPENYKVFTFEIPKSVNFSEQELENLRNQSIKKGSSGFQEKYCTAFIKKVLRTQI